jgi:hypothetical protein
MIIALTPILLSDLVVKLECDRVGKAVFPPPGYQDHIALNRWTKELKPEVHGRVEVVFMPPPTLDR